MQLESHRPARVATGETSAICSKSSDTKGRSIEAGDLRPILSGAAFEDSRLHVRARLAVGPFPASVVVQPDGQRASVASLWSRRVQIVDLAPLSAPADSVTLRVLHTLRLPFAPRCERPGCAGEPLVQARPSRD